MITQTNLHSIEMRRANGPRAGSQAPKTVPFEVAGKSHEMVFDGKLEDAVVRGTHDQGRLITDLSAAQKLFASDVAKKAFADLDAGAESVQVELGGQPWNATRKPENGIYEFAHSGLEFSSHRMQTDGQRVALHFEGDIGGMDPCHAKQRVFGAVNPNGTLTVLHEDLSLTDKAPVDSLWS